ncbi:hypothetical protein B0H19DRAFT_1271700 [Mycena capillaripes]|nr:hypothetical protein B0H19DRAFT_1271700 [Mycena capillaripes]
MSESSSPQPSSPQPEPELERIVYSQISKSSHPGLYARKKKIFEYIKTVCMPLLFTWEATKSNAATEKLARKDWILQTVYPMVDEKFDISGPDGFKIADFTQSLVKQMNNQFREMSKSATQLGAPVPSAATEVNRPPLTVKVTELPRQRKKTALDVFKKEHKIGIRTALATKEEGQKGGDEEGEKASAVGDEEGDGDGDEKRDGEGGEGGDGEDGKKGKGKSLARWNAVAAKLFEACNADTKAELEGKAADLNAELSQDLTESSLTENQDNLGNWLHTQLTRKIGHGPKQAGDVVFFLRYSMLRADGSLKHMRLSVNKTSNTKTRFEDEEEQGALYKGWAKDSLAPETAAEVQVPINPVLTAVPAPQTTTAAPASSPAAVPAAVPVLQTSTSAPASNPATIDKPTEDFSPALVKALAPARVVGNDGEKGSPPGDTGSPPPEEDILSVPREEEDAIMFLDDKHGDEEDINWKPEDIPQKDPADDGEPNRNEKKTFKRGSRKPTKSQGKKTAKKATAAAAAGPQAGNKRKRVDDEISEDAPAKKKGKQNEPLVEQGPSCRPTRVRAPPKARAAPGSPVVKVKPAEKTKGKGKKK